MNDETKDELMKRTREWLQSCVNAATRSGVPEEADLEAFILAHIDGEPERIAAARREAAEEKAEEGVRYWTDLAQAEARDAAALRARVAELEAQVQVMTGIREDRNEAIEALRGLVSLAEHAMAAANRDGAEYHPDEELREARAVLAKHPEGK